MLAEPPRGIGQPTAWPATPRIMPNAALGGGRRWLNPLEAVSLKRQLTEKWRCHTERVHGRAQVVGVPGQCQRVATRTATSDLGTLANQHTQPGARQEDCRSHAIRP